MLTWLLKSAGVSVTVMASVVSLLLVLPIMRHQGPQYNVRYCYYYTVKPSLMTTVTTALVELCVTVFFVGRLQLLQLRQHYGVDEIFARQRGRFNVGARSLHVSCKVIVVR